MLLHRGLLPKMKQPIVYSEDLRFMSIRSKRSSQKNKGNHTTTKLGIEQLESRLMNSIDALESSLQLLNSPGLFGSTQVVSNSTPSVSNTPPLVANPLRLTSGTAVLGRTASLSVLGADNNGESSLKYTWQPVEVPSGGNVSFASNGTNAAKNNVLSFNKSGTYRVNVTILDAQRLSSNSSLQFNVVQTLSGFLIKTSEGKSLPSGTTMSSSDARRDLTVQGLDQFGLVMAAQPSVQWQAVSVPTGGTATLATDGNAVSASFDRAGTYVLRAQSGSIGSTASINVTQTLTVLNVSNLSGAAIDPTEFLSVNSKNKQLTVRGLDQFGNAMATLPSVTWTTTTAPSGGTVAASRSNAVTTLEFSRIGTYTVRAQSGTASFTFSATVIPTFTSIGFRNTEGRVVAVNSSLPTAGTSYGLSAVGLDQYGTLLASQPTIVWQSSSSRAGAIASLETNGNAVTATFNRTGTYYLQSRSGSNLASVAIRVEQTLKSIRLVTSDGTSISPGSPIDVASANQRFIVEAIDQFGNTFATLPRTTWSTLSAPAGGAATVSVNAGIATAAFTRAGSYTLKALSGNISQYISFNVSQVLTGAIAVLSDNRQLANGASVPVTGRDLSLIARGLDQFRQLMTTQPDFLWAAISAPVGTSATLIQTGNAGALTFQRAGVYTVRASSGNATFNVTINVLQTITSLNVTPGTSSVQSNATQQYRYQTVDQFGQSLASQPSAIWTTTGGTITSSGVLNSGSRAGTFTVTAKVGNVSGTASIEVTAPTPQSTLRNAALSSLVNSLYADSQLTRTEMMQVLRSAGSDGVVDGSELEDLRYLTSTSSVYAMPAFVRELAKDVVNSNPANRTFKGQSAGNLAAGSSSTLLNNLVDKWFLGADEPVLTNSGLSYQIFVGNLFNGTPSRNDAKQGQLGDCYFIAALSAIADKNPDAVRNLFIDNNDGSYTVRFYDATQTVDYVTVNRRLPTNSGGRLEYSGYGLSVSSSATTGWIALAEKAYAQWNETGNEGRDGTNRYSSIAGGWMSNVNAQVLGTTSSNYAFSTTPKQTLIGAITASKAITLGTLQNASGGLVGGHAYTVAGYNASTDTFTLFNPWGTSHPAPLTWAQLQSNCSMFTVADASGSVANSLASVGSSTGEAFVGNWITVLVASGIDAAGTEDRTTHEMVVQDPILLILGSSLETESNLPGPDMSVAESNKVDTLVDAVEERLAAPLSASLVDLAMSQLKLNAI